MKIELIELQQAEEWMPRHNPKCDCYHCRVAMHNLGMAIQHIMADHDREDAPKTPVYHDPYEVEVPALALMGYEHEPDYTGILAGAGA